MFSLILFVVATAVDTCGALADAELLTAVREAARGYRWPTAADVAEGHAEFLRQPCPLVTTGDFDGDGTADRAVLLFRNRGNQKDGVLVAALRKGDAWQVEVLFRGTGLNFVSTGPPGSYRFFESAATTPSAPGEVLRMTAPSDVIISGTRESSEFVFARIKGRWVHVWTAN
jgi:hypothetical protein